LGPQVLHLHDSCTTLITWHQFMHETLGSHAKPEYTLCLIYYTLKLTVSLEEVTGSTIISGLRAGRSIADNFEL
jgi:hypothetical protein